MRCPICHDRRGKRRCPALGREICPVCCGTSRLVQIACPPTCGYLASATVHPPALIRRQQERDLAFLMPAIQGLSDAQGRLLSLVFSVLTRHADGGLGAARDIDVLDGVSSLVATLETAGKGVIYEHRPATLAGQRIVTDLNSLFADLARKGGRSLDSEAARVLARVRQLAESVHKASAGDDTAFLSLVKRVAKAAPPEGGAPSAPRSSIIVS